MTNNRDQIVYFMHIPKTGGASLLEIFRKHFNDSQFYRPLDREGPFGLRAEELSRYRFFTGHQVYDFKQLLPTPVKVITIFREPKQRVYSLYKHIWRLPTHWLHDKFVKNSTSLGQFLNDKTMSGYTQSLYADLLGAPLDIKILNERSHRFNIDPNKACEELRAMRRSIPIDVKIDIAKYRLDELTAIGITEHFESSIKLFSKLLGFPIPAAIPAVNKAPDNGEPQMESLPSTDMDALKEFTRYDEPIYRHAIEKFHSLIELSDIKLRR